MEATITIIMPVPASVFSVFMGLIVAALIYYAVKFVSSVITGG